MSFFQDLVRLTRARRRRHRYAQIVPLGVNCEVAFRFFRTWGFVDSSLAAWTQLFDLDTLVYTNNHLHEVMAGAATFDPVSKMWTCENCHVKFHGKLRCGYADTPEAIAADLADLRNRVDHLRRKLLVYASNDRETLFIHRISEKDEQESEKLASRLDALEESLLRLGARNWKLLVICEAPYLNRMPRGPNRVFRAVNQFNPIDDVTNSELGDDIGWKAIFSEFAPAIILPRQHGFKFETPDFQKPTTATPTFLYVDPQKLKLYGASNFFQYRFNRLRNHLAETLPFPRILAARCRRKTFVHVIPLGVNCETAFRFFRKWKFLDSSLLAWANSRDLVTLASTLSALPRLMTGEAEFNPAVRMWICRNTNVGFHGKLNLDAAVIPTQAEIDADLIDLRGRTEHLKAKLLAALADGQSLLFVHRLAKEDMRSPELGSRLDCLQRTLEQLGARNYTLLVVCERDWLRRMPGAPHRVFRAVNLFNALDHAADKNVGDAVGWQAIFTEFAPAKILPKAHKFKFE